MAIKVNGTTVIDDSRNLVNIASGAGSSTTYGDVGTYVFAVRIQAQVAAGSTAAGSSIREAMLYDIYTNTFNNESEVSGNSTFRGANTMSGTWRQMFGADIGNTTNNTRGGLWVRIS